MYICKYFLIQELVTPELYEHCAENNTTAKLWCAFDDRLLRALDGLRKRFGPLTVNTWASGGAFRESGLRDAATSTGSALSQHKFGRAVDFRSKNVTPDEIYRDLVKAGGLNAGFRNPHGEGWELIHRLEYYPGITWTHVDLSPNCPDHGAVKVFSA